VLNRIRFLAKNHQITSALPFALVMVLLTSACGPNQGNAAREEFGVQTPIIGDRVAAEVNGTLITEMDIEREAALQGITQPGGLLQLTSDDYMRLLHELIDQRLLALEAVKRGLTSDLEAQTRLRIARERILGNVLVERAVADAVTEIAIQRLYEEQSQLVQSGEEIHARHILVDSQEEAIEVRTALTQGANFATLAFERSKDVATRLEGGDLGYFSHAAMIAPFADAAFSLPQGQLSQPVATKYGWHIIKVEGRRKVQTPDLEELRPRIVQFMTFDQIQKLVSDLRENAVIKQFDPQIAPKSAPEQLELPSGE